MSLQHNMELCIEENDLKISKKSFQKMIFLMNALENGWKIYKKEGLYVFSKKHNNKKEIFDDNYLSSFIEENINFENIKMNFMEA